MAGTSPFDGILEGDEIERFLQQFVAPSAAADFSHFPRNALQVLQDVKAIWQDKGFLTPAALTLALIDRYTPDAAPEYKAYVAEVEAVRDAPEATTGYLAKDHAYTATGLAHLYAVEMKQPIAMVEADFSNMGGTNNYFAALLESEGVPQTEAAKKGMALTDAAVRLLCNSLAADAAAAMPKGASLVAIRTGGDEIRLLITGIEDKEQLDRLADRMHVGVERHVAAMGLQDHAHLKAPGDAKRNGFGVALAIQDMRDIANPQTLVQELDARITQTKNDLGLARIGKIDKELVQAEIEAQLASGEFVPPAGQAAAAFVAGKVEAMEHAAQKVAAHLHSLNPQHNTQLQGGSLGFRQYLTAMAERYGGPRPKPEAPGRLTTPDPIGDNRPEGVPPLAPLEARWNAIAIEDLAEKGVSLNAAERHLLKLSVSGLAAKDPSAQTFMPGIVGLTVEAYAAETAEFRGLFNAADTVVKQKLAEAGLASLEQLVPQAMAVSFHNVAGLNAALGHHQADIVLRHMAAGIIEQAMHAAGIPEGPPKPYAVAHHGGGNFSVMVQPGGFSPEGTPWFASYTEMRLAELEIERLTRQLNGKSVAVFLDGAGVALSAEARQLLPATFGDIADPKVRQAGENRGRVNGIHAATASAPLVFRERDKELRNNDIDGFGFMSRLRNSADGKMEKLRNTLLMMKMFKTGLDFDPDDKDTWPIITPLQPRPAQPKQDDGKMTFRLVSKEDIRFGSKFAHPFVKGRPLQKDIAEEKPLMPPPDDKSKPVSLARPPKPPRIN